MNNDLEKDKKLNINTNYIVIEDSIYKDSRLSANDILIYGLIASLSNNEEKQCFAQNKTLAQIRNLTVRKIQQSIRKLKLLNYIVVYYDENNHNIRYLRTYMNQKIIERDKSNALENHQIVLEDYDWLNEK